MNEPTQQPEEEQLTLFGEGDHGDLTEEEVPEFYHVPGGIIIERDREEYP